MMKKALLFMLIAFGIALSAPNTVHKGTITFFWDPPEPLETVDGYNLYVTTNLPPGISVPVDDKALKTTVLPPQATNIFQFYMAIPAPATNVTLTNVWSELGTWAFFVITASNRVGESPFSNPAAIPAPLSGRGNLRVEINR